MNYMKIETASVSNGLGFRVVLWVSGCTQRCPGCQNPETWDFDAGYKFTEQTKQKLFEVLDKPWVKGITFSGGHPLEYENIGTVTEIIEDVREKFPDKDIWLYTGFSLTYDDFRDESLFSRTLWMCTYIVDGPFILSQRDITLPFRGSTNQRIIDVQQTLASGTICECQINT
ncbi:MAG: anaerobic ribonucleoside-triphosphate reductase activating protein [Candidatus Gastranaerophilales bacterium]|nr:anaerobic ribonucleoside-triphosphate reductase activating protein [Candidatus Gastranaerophilales bacterium]